MTVKWNNEEIRDGYKNLTLTARVFKSADGIGEESHAA